MLYSLERSDDEIDAVLNKCTEAAGTGSRYGGLSYEEGVDAAIRWMIGHNEDPPLGDE